MAFVDGVAFSPADLASITDTYSVEESAAAPEDTRVGFSRSGSYTYTTDFIVQTLYDELDRIDSAITNQKDAYNRIVGIISDIETDLSLGLTVPSTLT